MAEFRMPSLGADMDHGTLLEWLVHPGDVVRRGDIVAVVDTAKAAVEVECFDSGVVERLLVEPGVRVAVGTPLATIAAAEAAAPASSPEGPVPAPVPSPQHPVPGVPGPVAPSGKGRPAPFPPVRHLARQRDVDLGAVRGSGPAGRVTHADVVRAAAARRRVSPLARRTAAELGVDLRSVAGTGPDGAITARDVHAAAEARTGVPEAASGVGAPAEARSGAPEVTYAGVPEAVRAAEPEAVRAAEPEVGRAAGPVDRTAAIRAATAALMARSKREIPHYYLSETIDLHRAVDWLSAHNRRLPVPRRLVPAALLLKAVAVAATQVVEVNGFWRDDAFVPAPAVSLGVAVSLRGGGLVAPALHGAATLDLDALMARLRDLVTRARAGRLRRAELSDPSLTVSNLGDQGVESMLGVIYPPQVALVGFGRVANRPLAEGDLLAVRPAVTATLAADHRASDGATGARFLRTVARLLQTPEGL